ncbi:hypothetical protein RHGRI_023447 [Rhododendron griersonianum]|uniref:Putative plant transposon protein domain-containing protein n=1 Tax=Rhododendron griersonianum TaxID=479676 RepID=A0AAV6J915_9ERIC|nr:hypothetical protein RHGRI_023447 [Rhododendron griersonianum]
MARNSLTLNPSTTNPKISAPLAWVLMFLVGLGLLLMVVVVMAGGKKKVTAKRARGGGSNRASEIEEEEEEIDVEMEEPGGSQPVTRKNWKSGMAGRGFKCERQVDIKSLGTELHGIPHIATRGLGFWFKNLKGYNKACVIEFYQNMVSMMDGPVNEMRIESMIDNVRVVLTPTIIAKYLGYTRPPLSTVNYPLDGGEYIDPAIVNNALYSDISFYDGHHKPGHFKEEFRFLNKVIHANLFPRGSEHHPRQRGAELLFMFASGDYVFDAALWIFYQVYNFQAESQNSARMPFPCMISKICKSQKVRGPRFAHLEPLKPGALDASFVTKSKSQSHDPPSPKRKGKMAEMTKTPGPKEKQDSWIKKMFCMVVHLVKENRELKRERKLDRKMLSRQSHKVDWLVERHPAAAEYVAPPEVESEDSDEDIDENDEELNPGFF